MKTYKVQLRHVRYEQIEVTASNEKSAYLLAVSGKGDNRLMTTDRSEVLALEETSSLEDRRAFKRQSNGNSL